MKLFLATLLFGVLALAGLTTTVTQLPGKNEAWLYSHAMTNSADLTTSAMELPTFKTKTVQVSGTFGGATVTVEGSNNCSTYATLKNANVSGDMTFAVAGVKLILENPRCIRMRSTGAATSTDLTASILYVK